MYWKGQDFYHPQESCFVRLPRVADLFCELHGLLLVVGLAVLPADVKSNWKRWHRRLQDRGNFRHWIISSVLSWLPAILFHGSALACSLPSGTSPNSRDGEKYPKSYQTFFQSVWLSSQLISESHCRNQIPPCLPNTAKRLFRNQILAWVGRAGKWFLGNSNIDLFTNKQTNHCFLMSLQTAISFPSPTTAVSLEAECLAVLPLPCFSLPPTKLLCGSKCSQLSWEQQKNLVVAIHKRHWSFSDLAEVVEFGNVEQASPSAAVNELWCTVMSLAVKETRQKAVFCKNESFLGILTRGPWCRTQYPCAICICIESCNWE